MAAGSANVFVKFLTFFLLLFLTNIVESQEYNDVESAALDDRNARAIFFRPRLNGYFSVRRQIRGYIPPVSKRRVISIMRPDKRPVDDVVDLDSMENYDKRAVIFIPPRQKPGNGRRIGKRFYDENDDFSDDEYEKRAIVFVPPGARPFRRRVGRTLMDEELDDENSIEKRSMVWWPRPHQYKSNLGKRTVISVLRPEKRYEPVYDPFFGEFDEPDVGKRGIISVIRPGKGKRDYDHLIHGIGKRTGYNVVSHGIGKRTGYSVITHGLGKRDYDADWVDDAVAKGIGKRGVGRVMRLPGKRWIDNDYDDSEEFEGDK